MQFQQNQRIFINIISFQMEEVQLSRIKGLHSFLQPKTLFSNININKQQKGKAKKLVRLKIAHKLLPTLSSDKKLAQDNCTLRSEMYKRSRTFYKEGDKKVHSAKQLSQKNCDVRRRCQKKPQFKPQQNKLKFIKSTKNKAVLKKPSKLPKMPENSKASLRTNDRMNIKQVKSSNYNQPSKAKQNIKMLAKRKQNMKQANIIQDYFGTREQISSYLQQNAKNIKNALSKSKVKTHSNSNISIKSNNTYNKLKLVHRKTNK